MNNEEIAIRTAEKVGPGNFVNFVKTLFKRFEEEKSYFGECKKEMENQLRQIVAAIRTGSIPANGRMLIYQGYIKSRSSFSPDATFFVFVDNLAIYSDYLREAFKEIATVKTCKFKQEDTIDNEIEIIFNRS